MDISWELVGVAMSMIGGSITILLKLNSVENEYQLERVKLKEVEARLLQTIKDLEIQHKESARLKSQIGKEFNNIAWQLRIIIGSLADVENFLKNSSGYNRRKGTGDALEQDEDTRGFMLKKIKELDSLEEE